MVSYACPLWETLAKAADLDDIMFAHCTTEVTILGKQQILLRLQLFTDDLQIRINCYKIFVPSEQNNTHKLTK